MMKYYFVASGKTMQVFKKGEKFYPPILWRKLFYWFFEHFDVTDFRKSGTKIYTYLSWGIDLCTHKSNLYFGEYFILNLQFNYYEIQVIMITLTIRKKILSKLLIVIWLFSFHLPTAMHQIRQVFTYTIFSRQMSRFLFG